MPTAALLKDVNVDGEHFQENVTITSDDKAVFDPPAKVPAAKAGTLTVRGGNTAGTLTLGTGHGVITGDRLDVFWATGCRYGCVVGTVSGNNVPITGGAGDNLPALNFTIQASVPTSEGQWALDATTVVVVTAKCPKQCVFVFAADDDTTLLAVPLLEGGVYTWTSEDNASNPLSGTIAKVFMSHADTAAAARMNGVMLYD